MVIVIMPAVLVDALSGAAKRALQAGAEAAKPQNAEQQQALMLLHQAAGMAMVALGRIAEHGPASVQKALDSGALGLSKSAFKSAVPPWHAAAAVLLRALDKQASAKVRPHARMALALVRYMLLHSAHPVSWVILSSTVLHPFPYVYVYVCVWHRGMGAWRGAAPITHHPGMTRAAPTRIAGRACRRCRHGWCSTRSCSWGAPCRSWKQVGPVMALAPVNALCPLRSLNTMLASVVSGLGKSGMAR